MLKEVSGFLKTLYL